MEIVGGGSEIWLFVGAGGGQRKGGLRVFKVIWEKQDFVLFVVFRIGFFFGFQVFFSVVNRDGRCFIYKCARVEDFVISDGSIGFWFVQFCFCRVQDLEFGECYVYCRYRLLRRTYCKMEDIGYGFFRVIQFFEFGGVFSGYCVGIRVGCTERFVFGVWVGVFGKRYLLLVS